MKKEKLRVLKFIGYLITDATQFTVKSMEVFRINSQRNEWPLIWTVFSKGTQIPMYFSLNKLFR